MKILQVIPYLYPEAGGDVNVCTSISHQLVGRGHQVTIATTDYNWNDQYAEGLRKNGIVVIPFHVVASFALFLYTPSMRKWLNSNITGFDIAHLHGFRSYQNVLLHKSARERNLPYVLQAHGSVLPFSGRRALKRAYDVVWGSQILRDARKALALSETEENQYIEMGVSKDCVEVIPNGIEPSEYLDLPGRGEFKKKYGIGPDEKMIVYVGRIHRTKGVDMLVRSFSRLHETNGARLAIVGPDGGQRKELEKLILRLNIAKKVRLVGFVAPRERMAALVDADVFVTPRFYGFPVTFLEACACGVPIVTTNGGDRLDWIDGNVGLVTEYDEQKLANAIETILRDGNVRKRCSLQGMKIVGSTFNWSEIVRRIEGVYSDLIERRNQSG